MTRITIETNIDGSNDISKVVVEDSVTLVSIDDMYELFIRAICGLGFSRESLEDCE